MWAVIIEMASSQNVVVIGLKFLIIDIIIMMIIVVIFLVSFDLQDQCSCVELLGIFLGFFLFFFSCFVVFLYNVHYVILLLFIEVLLLGVFLLIRFYYFLVYGLFGMFVFLLIMVCMGGFRVSILVFLSRFSGRDFWFFSIVV